MQIYETPLRYPTTISKRPFYGLNALFLFEIQSTGVFSYTPFLTDMKAISLLTDFSYDFQDLDFRKIP